MPSNVPLPGIRELFPGECSVYSTLACNLLDVDLGVKTSSRENMLRSSQPDTGAAEVTTSAHDRSVCPHRTGVRLSLCIVAAGDRPTHRTLSSIMPLHAPLAIFRLTPTVRRQEALCLRGMRPTIREVRY